MNDYYLGKLFHGLLYYLEYRRPTVFRGLPEGFNESMTIETITGVVERMLECIICISLELIFKYQSKLTRICCLDVYWIPESKAIMNKI